MRRMSEAFIEKFEHERAHLHVSTIVVAELEYGVANSAQKVSNARRLEQFLSQVSIVNWDHACARAYAQVRLTLKAQPISAEDTMIAACAVAYNATMVTHNVREFSRVPGLLVEDWITQYG